MQERRRSSAFRRFEKMILLLRNRGVTDRGIDAFIRDKILCDLAQAKAAQKNPSLN